MSDMHVWEESGPVPVPHSGATRRRCSGSDRTPEMLDTPSLYVSESYKNRLSSSPTHVTMEI